MAQMAPNNNTSRASPPDLPPQQKDYVQRLWRSHNRELVDVKASVESKQKPVSGHNYRFLLRLHAFCVNVIQAEATTQQQQSTTRNGGSGQRSCLRPFLHLAFPQPCSSQTSSANDNNHQARRLALSTGRRVIALHHEDFMSELNRFELNGQEDEDFIRRESFGAFLYHMPRDALAALGTAMGLSLVTTLASLPGPDTLVRFLDASQIIVRFVHVQPCVRMMDVKTGLVGKFLTIKGHVVRARPKRLKVAAADFGCSLCGKSLVHAFEGGSYSVPTSCPTENCKARGGFVFLRSTARYMAAQELRLQEAQEEGSLHAGRTPRQLDVELTHDLVDACRPGDIVLVACQVAAVNTAVAAGKTGKRAADCSTYTLQLKGHSITTLSESNNDSNRGSSNKNNSQQGDSSQVTYTQHQLESITRLCHADHFYFGLMERRAFPFDLLVRSLCPSIIGHNEVKAGLLLCLLGGTPPNANETSSIRCNSHILIVGDPGMGKSQMLLAASQLAARSVYVGGNTSSTTGLTVTLTKEEGGEAGMEAGALVLADQGICCIDEFDKMQKSHQDGLLEAMEQQQVSIAKAGVVASLPSRCSVVAAANPRHGSYTMTKSVAENLNMAKPILSRFDLVFILRDKADKDLDRMVSNNIINLYRNTDSELAPIAISQPTTMSTQNSAACGPEASATKMRMRLSERLAWVTDFQKQPLPADLVRDYIAYAREYCKPKLTPDAAAVLKDYFMELRYPADGRRRKDTVPITTRQLEALIRLCQARAKACLRDFVLKEDALDVVELMSKSVEQVHSDEAGGLDPTRGGAGGTSSRKIKKAFTCEVQRIVGIGAECTIDDLRRVAEKVGCGLHEFQTIVEDLRGNGVLMKKPNGNYQVLT